MKFEPIAARLLVLFFCLSLNLACEKPRQETVDRPSPPNESWSQWRGPNRNGTLDDSSIFDQLVMNPREIWRRPLGQGFSGPAVSDGQVFTLFSIEDRETLIALDLADGRELWRYDLGQTLRESHGDGPRSTPILDNAGRLFALSSLGNLVAVDAADGREIWQQPLIDPPTWGYASSPLIWKEQLFIHGRIDGKQAVLAISPDSGELIWSADAEHLGYASPLMIEFQGDAQMVSFLGDSVIGFDPSTGDRLWEFPWQTAYGVNAADPIFLPPDRLFISSGYLQGAALLQLRSNSDGIEVSELWKSREMRNHFSTSVAVDGLLYGFDNSILKCLQLDDAEVLWRQRGLGKGSLIAAGQLLILLDDRGQVHFAQASPDSYNEIGSFKALSGPTWTPPVLVGPWLVLRDQQEMVVFDLAAS